MKRILLSTCAWLLSGGLALAQVNTVPQIGVTSGIVKQVTYSAISHALVPDSSATDIFCIAGSSTKAISVKQIRVTGTAGTLVTAPFTLLHRVTLDTGGTAATGTALPVGAPNLPTDPAATATLTAYTANPTINDSSPTYYRTAYTTIPTTAAGTSINPLLWTFGEQVGLFTRALDIAKGATTQQYCLNLNSTSISSGLLEIEITWVEN